MDYMEIVKRSFKNAWQYKFLWLFGFFVSITDGFGGGQWWGDKFDRGDWGHWGDWDYRFKGYRRFEDYLDFHIEPMVIVMAALGILALVIIFWALSVISEGALIRGISRKYHNLKTGFGDCWSVGLNKFFRIFGITLLAFISIFAAIIFLIMIIVPFWFIAKPLGIMVLIMSIPIFFAYIVFVICLEGWAIRYGILFDEDWLSAIGKGWQLFWKNIGQTLGVAFSSFLTQLIAWFVLLLCAIFLAVPLVLLGIYNLWLGLIPGLVLAFFVIVFSSAFFGVFASSVWTLGFMKLTGYSQELKSSESELVVS